MEFYEQLSDYMKELNISVHEMALACDVSDSVISRYKNGARIPDSNSDILSSISKVIADRFIQEKEDDSINAQSYDEIYGRLLSLIPNANINKEAFRTKLNLLFDTLNISISAFSKAANYDSSFISRICNGKRFPSDYDAFSTSVSDYIASLCRNSTSYNKLRDIIPALKDLSSSESNLSHSSLAGMIKSFLLSDDSLDKNSSSTEIFDFINKISDFDLEDYVRAIHFDKLKVPTFPLHFPTAKRYFGIQGTKAAELDFLKAAALEPANRNVYMYSRFPMEDMIEDVSFSKKWMFGLAALLKKGHTLHMIHNLDRPYREMMAGLQNWIPLYMTGQIVPYYIPDDNDDIYYSILRTSDSVALYGDCVRADINTASLYLTRTASELKIYEKRKQLLFERALPLMDIYTVYNIDEFYDFLNDRLSGDSYEKIQRLLDTPPIHALTQDMFIKIATENDLSKKDLEKLLGYLAKQKTFWNASTKKNSLTEIFPILSEEEFKMHPINFYISGIRLTYSYDMYLEHIKMTYEKSRSNTNYSIKENNQYPFRNIQLSVIDRDLAIVSKNASPSIHFVIHHPMLVNAIAEFMPIIFEEP